MSSGPIHVEHVDFVSVPTQDIERSMRFYGETLGLEHEKDTPVGAEYRAGQVTLGVYVPEKVGRSFAAHTGGIALRVPDVAEARRALETKGVTFEGEIYDTGVCHMALFDDPDGNLLMLHRRYAS